MVKKLSCVSCGSLKRFPHTFTTISDSYSRLDLWIASFKLKKFYKGFKECAQLVVAILSYYVVTLAKDYQKLFSDYYCLTNILK